MAEEGATVAVVDRDESSRALCGERGRWRWPCLRRERSPSRWQRPSRQPQTNLGGLSLVFANAGIGTMAAVGEMDPGEWHKIIEVNLSGVFHTVRECIPLSRSGWGWICGLHCIDKRCAVPPKVSRLTRPPKPEWPHSVRASPSSTDRWSGATRFLPG